MYFQAMVGKLGSRLVASSRLRSYSTVPTIHDVRQGLQKLTAFDPNFGDRKAKKADNQAVSSQAELKAERMNESYVEAVIPLGDRPELRNKYSNFLKGVRFGRLLEDLDTMAVHIAYQHNKSQCVEVSGNLVSPIVIVTGSVDNIKISDYKAGFDSNIKMSGFTSWVGTTSCEVTMRMEQEQNMLLEAKFLMVARNLSNVGKGIMNPLELVDEKEKMIFKQGEENKNTRIHEIKNSLAMLPPNVAESLAIHEMYKKTIDLKSGSLNVRHKPENMVWMEDSKLKNVIICHPEQRNLYNKIFGGFLMRQAYEIAWANSYIYGKATPRCVAVDDISFKKPVLIGSLLFLSSQVVCTDARHMMVKVLAQTVNPMTNEAEITNDFYFKFTVPDEVTQLPQVLPKSYSEYMLNIDGKRHM